MVVEVRVPNGYMRYTYSRTRTQPYQQFFSTIGYLANNPNVTFGYTFQWFSQLFIPKDSCFTKMYFRYLLSCGIKKGHF